MAKHYEASLGSAYGLGSRYESPAGGDNLTLLLEEPVWEHDLVLDLHGSNEVVPLN